MEMAIGQEDTHNVPPDQDSETLVRDFLLSSADWVNQRHF